MRMKWIKTLENGEKQELSRGEVFKELIPERLNRWKFISIALETCIKHPIELAKMINDARKWTGPVDYPGDQEYQAAERIGNLAIEIGNKAVKRGIIEETLDEKHYQEMCERMRLPDGQLRLFSVDQATDPSHRA